MHKLPYIADKKMYAAVMGACSYVRDTGYFNKATSYYADKYNVDVEEVRRYVRIAQGNGQKQAAKRKKWEYKWYVVIILRDWYCAGDCGEYESWHWDEQTKREHTTWAIKRATSAENAKKQCFTPKNCSIYYLLSVPHEENRAVALKEFNTEQEAKEFCESLTWDSVKKLILKS